MRMPIQSVPVSRRGVSTAAMKDTVAPSNIPCDICMAGCDQLSGIAKSLCQLACSKTVC